MANIAAIRVQREFKEVRESEELVRGHITLELMDNTWKELKGEILGPADTPYEGGRFQLEIQIPDVYPFSPPKIRFITSIWHPNVSSVTGHICLNILKDEWTAALSLRTALLSVQALLSSAEPDDPQDAVVATQYKFNKELYKLTAQHWTNVYAGGPNPVWDFDNKVARLVDMGIDHHMARVSLSTINWKLQEATDYLFR